MLGELCVCASTRQHTAAVCCVCVEGRCLWQGRSFGGNPAEKNNLRDARGEKKLPSESSLDLFLVCNSTEQSFEGKSGRRKQRNGESY